MEALQQPTITLTKTMSVPQFSPQPCPRRASKRQSIQRRLSGQKSVQDLVKNLKIEDLVLGREEDEGKNNMQRGLMLKSLANLTEGQLKQKYESDPFLRVHLKHLTRGMKENLVFGVKKSTTNNNTKPPKQTQLLDKISYRQHKQKIAASETQMLKKVINIVNQSIAYA